MQKYFKKKDIEKLRSYSTINKAAVAERALRTLKQRLYRYFSRKHTLNWMDILPNIIAGINKTKSRVIGMRPIDVTPKNSQEIWESVFAPYVKRKGHQKAKFDIGDTVRMAKDNDIFAKGFLPNYSDEIVQIEGIKRVTPTIYRLKDDAGETFLTKFYGSELSRTRKDPQTVYRIEEIIKERRRRGVKEYLVKFIDYPQPEWIKEKDIEK
jgi:hypothetical protein